MSTPTNIDARRFWRVALQRLEDGQTVLQINRPKAAMYLAGYAVECMLKALLICGTSAGRREELVRSFRGARWHNPIFLFEQLRQDPINIKPPVSLSRDITLVATWSPDLRYEAGIGDRQDAARFLEAVRSIVAWADGKMN